MPGYCSLGVFQKAQSLIMKSKNSSIAIGVALGSGIGVAMGVAFKNIAMGLALGVAIGTALGAGMYQKGKKEEEQPK